MPDTLTPSNPSALTSPVSGRDRGPSAGTSRRPAEEFRPFGNITPRMLAALVEHVKEPQPVTAAGRARQTTDALVRRRLVRFDTLKTHRQSFITDQGREIAARVLAVLADQLVERTKGNA